MKVLIIAPYFFEPHRWMISAYKTALNLAKKCQVIVLTTGKPAYEELNRNIKIYRLFDIFLPDPINYSIVPGLFFKLWKVIKKEKPDIFLVNKHMFFTSFSLIFLKFLKKKVITVTDTFPGINWQPKKSIVKFVMKIYAYVIGYPLLKLSNLVVLLHEGLIPTAKKLKLNYTVIHNGVDPDDFKNPVYPTDLPKSENDIFISYIGRLESIKGYYDLLEVAVTIIPQYPQVKFLFIGDKTRKDKIINKYRSQNIIFLGHRHDIPSLLSVSDIFVLSSYSEGLPNALMEAMAAGTACLASNVGGVRILIENMKNGLTFEPGNKQELKEKILLLIQNKTLRLQLGQAAKEKIVREFNWRYITDEYIKLFKTLLNSN